METPIEDNDRNLRVLESFLIDNNELEELEHQPERFNLFEAIGMVQQEIRHSHFLAYLLDPQRSHGLGDTFAVRLIHKAVDKARSEGIQFDRPITPVELALWSLDNLTVMREWNHIDILLLDHSNQIAVIVENKIFTDESKGQLNAYYKTVNRQYPGWGVNKHGTDHY